MIFFVIAVSFLTGEFLLRVLDIPGIDYNTAKYDELTGGKYYPGSTTSYKNSKGDRIRRKANRMGYLDVEHEQNKRQGVYRIGFFGDSFTEARQVRLEETFFRIIERGLRDYNVECISFGISGYSTLQSYLTSEKYTVPLDLDMVVYVFVENDLGDQIPEIARSREIPTAVLSDDGFRIVESFRENSRYKNSFIFKVGDFMTAHSLLASTVLQRIKLLLRHGVKISLTEDERSMATRLDDSSAKRIPNQIDVPSSWPEGIRNYATSLGERIILKWRTSVEGRSKKFAVFYVPREQGWQQPAELQDSWKLWLMKFAESEKIDFIDPTESFLSASGAGRKIYDDHFTPEGHQAFANAFITWYISKFLD